jgi:hypothetical protein
MFYVAAVALCALVATPIARAEGDHEQARQHFLAGQSKYNHGDYKAAIVEFMAADAISPSPMLSFNVALCYDKLGENGLAAELYKDYLKRRPDAPNRAQVEARIASLGTTAPAAAPPPTAPPPAAEVPVKPPEGTVVTERETVPPPPPDEEETNPPVPPAAGNQTPPSEHGDAEQAPRPKRYDRAFADRVPAHGGTVPPYAPNQPYAPSENEHPPYQPAQPQQPADDDTPVYKEWWFWTVIGVGVVGVIVLSNSGHSNNTPASTASGLTLFHF